MNDFIAHILTENTIMQRTQSTPNTSPNITLHRVFGFPLTQHVPRGIWNSIVEFLGHRIFILTMIDTTTSSNPLLRELIQNNLKNASTASIKRFMTCLTMEEQARHDLQHDLHLLRLERFNSIPEMKHPMVRSILRDFARSLCDNNGQIIESFSDDHLIHIKQFNLMKHLFRFTPTQKAKYLQPPMKNRTHEEKHILSVIALLFVEWNRMFDVDESNIRAIIAIVTGHVSYIGKRNQRNYRLLDESCFRNCHPLFTVINFVEQYNWGKL